MPGGLPDWERLVEAREQLVPPFLLCVVWIEDFEPTRRSGC